MARPVHPSKFALRPGSSMPSSVPTSADCAEPPNTDERLFDHGCALFFEAALDQPLLALDLMMAMHSGSTEPDSAAPTADPRGV